MLPEWHYSRDGNDYGPVSSSELLKLAKSGQLLATDLLWKEGMAEWKPASSFPKLFPPKASADEMPVFVITDKKPKTTVPPRVGTKKQIASPVRASPTQQKALDPLLVGLALFFVAPWGLYLLWRHPVLKNRTKWWVLGCGWLLLLLIAGVSGDGDAPGGSKTQSAEGRRGKSDSSYSRNDRQASAMWQEGARNGEHWANKIERATRNGESPLVMEKYRESINEIAENYLRQITNQKRNIAQFTEMGSEVPQTYRESLSRAQELYDGFMSQAGKYVR